MSIERGDFDGVSRQDLEELLQAQVPEGFTLEFKSELYGNADADKKELLKDVAALANAHGGHIVLGIKEENGIASSVVSVLEENADAEILRMEQIIRSGTEPSVPNIRIKAIPLDPSGYALVLRIPRSWIPPHRVIFRGSNRFHIRNSAGVHEPTLEELRMLFTQSTSALEQAKHFRDERIRTIISGEGVRPLVGSGRLVVHVVPVAAFSGMISLDLENVHQHHQAFWPFGAMGVTPRFNYHGFVNERGGDENYGYTQIFRNGCVEATKASIVREMNGRHVIPGADLERHVFTSMPQYFDALRDLGVPTPLLVFVTLEGVAGAKYAVIRDTWDVTPDALPNDTMLLPEGVLESYGSMVDYHAALRPAFDALWNACGFVRSQFFDEEGLWVGQRQR